jgi:hypothetical protein
VRDGRAGGFVRRCYKVPDASREVEQAGYCVRLEGRGLEDLLSVLG